jgi:hypothetical protein
MRDIEVARGRDLFRATTYVPFRDKVSTLTRAPCKSIFSEALKQRWMGARKGLDPTVRTRTPLLCK